MTVIRVAEIVANVLGMARLPRSARLAVMLGIAVLAASGCGRGGQATTSASTAATGADGGPESPAGTAARSTTSASGKEQASTSGSAATATPTDVVAQANAICAQRNSELKAAAKRGAKLQEIVASAPRRAEIERAALEKLRRLTPPPAVARDWQTTLVDSERALRNVSKLADSAGSHDAASVHRQAALVDRPQLGLLVAGTHAGLKQCSILAGPSVLGL